MQSVYIIEAVLVSNSFFITFIIGGRYVEQFVKSESIFLVMFYIYQLVVKNLCYEIGHHMG